MVQQATAAKPKTSNISHKSLPVCACRKLAGFAEFAQICGTTPTRNRDANGNRTSKTTPWGTVKYAYDKENRMTESGDLGKSESVKYTYDANGNLLSEVAGRYQKDYVYNAQNRMAFSEVLDRAENTRNLTEYRYDAFGRRIETIEYLGDHTRNLYDGFSFDIAEKTVLQTHAAATMPEQKYRAGGAGANSSHPEPGSGSASTGRSGAGVANGTRYRYIGDEPLVPLENAGGNTGANASTSTAAAKTRSRPNSEYVLYAYGEPVGTNSDNEISYFGTDILGSVRSVTDKYGNVKASYEYDAFGTPYLSNLENDVGFGYCGKVYDSATGLYDYGFRDYNSASARFITVDPIRDGSNWYSYCMNDAVNYVDLWGLEIRLSEDASVEDINNYNLAIRYLNTSERAREIIDFLTTAEDIVRIEFIDDDNDRYVYDSKTIKWDSDSALVLSDDRIQSAALGLIHEMGHAEYQLHGLWSDSQNERERYNMENNETPVAIQLHEPVRDDYDDFIGFRTMSTSTEHTTSTGSTSMSSSYTPYPAALQLFTAVSMTVSQFLESKTTLPENHEQFSLNRCGMNYSGNDTGTSLSNGSYESAKGGCTK